MKEATIERLRGLPKTTSAIATRASIEAVAMDMWID